MRKPIYVRSLSETEHEQLEAGLRSNNAFVLRRCQILLASARGQHARIIGANLGCDDQTVRNVIHAFNARGLAVLRPGSSRPLSAQPIFDAPKRERLRAILHQSPRAFGKQSSLWTLELAAEVSFAEGLTPRQVSGETIRQALGQLGARSPRAKHWITSSDPAYVSKKNSVTA